jgi:hypothetical protein
MTDGNWEKSESLLFLALWLGTLIWFARTVSWRRYRDGGDRLLAKVSMPLFMLYIVCCFSIYEAPQPTSPGVLQILPVTPPAGLATIERDSWRREWWCAEPVPGVNEWLNYDRQAAIKCNNQRREWCAYHPVGPWEDGQEQKQPGIIERNSLGRSWCIRHPADSR